MSCQIGGQGTGRRPAPALPEYSCAQAAPSTWPKAGRETARRTCWLGIPKIELSVFVPGPWVVDGASPERRFSHAAITCTETFTPCKDHCFSCGDADPLAPYGQLLSCINRGRLESNVMLSYIETRIANFALFLRLRHHKIIPHRPPHTSAITPGRPRS